MRFMACACCWLFHQIDDDGNWIWRCDEEQEQHDIACRWLAQETKTKGVKRGD